MKVEATAARTRHTITVTDGTEIFFKDWGAGQPIVFSHGSPLNSDAWEDQMVFLADRGYRCIAHDRRGHGRSSQPWIGNDVDTYAADLAALVEELDLHDAVHVAHSTGAGEVARYIGRQGTSRVAKVVLVGARDGTAHLGVDKTGADNPRFDAVVVIAVLNEFGQRA